ncbi:DnaJ domain-containing protein [Photobacterium lipolyticum]|uniref:Molecular chaperone DnaJ n=1 Tax=Photobacterium lipolyticum TaxID=266810 RepID=A0A2T3N146_9GAMM|nr:DnaJ domain-containing protein [Photobacterium lipolyticum]PSW06023.1 molecular chaperone DnaJ [Photobacterium lipolyticum]
MASFHDILGTDKNTSSDEVKRRYKLLSTRFHPDKGGSKVIMQLISQAYDQVGKGKGHEEAVHTLYIKDPAIDNYVGKILQLERDYKQLKESNDALKRKLKQAHQENKQKYSADARQPNAGNEEKKLRAKNDRLKAQLAEARRELREKSRDVKPFGADSGNQPGVVLSQKVSAQIKSLGRFNARRIAVFMIFPVIFLTLMLMLGKEPWLALYAMINEPADKPKTVVTVLDINPDDLVSQQRPQKASELETVAPAKPKPAARIKMEQIAGSWQYRYFENTQRPYVSVRSEKGSYIVKSCEGGFKYYRNDNLRSHRLPANMIFERRDRHFTIYKLPYGNGSSVTNWSESKSLLINEEYFPNKGFADSYYQLTNACLSTS